jgi:hypothetical protein
MLQKYLIRVLFVSERIFSILNKRPNSFPYFLKEAQTIVTNLQSPLIIMWLVSLKSMIIVELATAGNSCKCSAFVIHVLIYTFID